MPKKKTKMSEIEAREREILSSQVRMDGVGEDPAVRAVLSDDFVNGTNVEAMNIALALQQVLKGQAALLDNDRKFSDELHKLQSKMAKIDEDAVRFNEDRQRWLDEINSMADKLRVSEQAREKIQAKAAVDMVNQVQAARASISMDRAAFDAALEREPKETVTSPGVSEMVMENGSPVAKLYPEEVRIKHRRWILYPGVPQELPRSVAEMIRNRRKSQMETAERQAAMRANMESSLLDAKMKEIDRKYNSSTARLGE